MDLTQPSIETLFEQLGLSGETADIDDFIASHRPLPDGVLLPDAPFWTPAQSQFLREEFKDDAEWIPIVDQLNVRLRA
jgi:hypothetical protein